MPQRCKSAGQKGHLHFLCAEGRKRGISRRPQVFVPQRDLKSQMSRTVESPSCASRSTPIQHCRNSRTALSTLKLMEKASSSTTPISVPLPITGCRRCSRPRSSITSVPGHPHHRQRSRAECIRTRHDLRTVPGRRIPDAGYPVRQKVSGIGRCTDMKERIVDEQIRLIPYYQNDAVSFSPVSGCRCMQAGR